METKIKFILTRKFLFSLAGAVIWMSFPPGVYLSLEGFNEGILLILLALWNKADAARSFRYA